MDWPKKRNLLVLGYQDAYEAGDHVLEVIEAGPIGLEGVDDYLVAAVKKKNIQPGSTDTRALGVRVTDVRYRAP